MAKQEDPEKYNKLIEEINTLKGEIAQMGKVVKVLENNNQQLVKENERYKDSSQG